MVKFSATIEKYGEKAHQTGWTVITIPAKIAHKINPGCKKSFRVKGKLDAFEITKVALMPAGEGDFIMPLNAAMRKGIRKQKNDSVKLQLALDEAPILPPSELIECMQDEPEALAYFNSLPQSHRNYFTKWIDSAKTDPTKAKRIALVIKTMIRKMDFGAMLREEREERRKLMG
ncbi:MAG: YdeI/OmpD-associated family protein [Ferruginibacter sp.]